MLRRPDWRALVNVAFRAGYAEAVARLRDNARYDRWWTSTGAEPDVRIRHHLADYLEVVGLEALGQNDQPRKPQRDEVQDNPEPGS